MTKTPTKRDKYLRGLAEERGIDLYIVRQLADMLGPSEDYDGLVTALDDWEDFVTDNT